MRREIPEFRTTIRPWETVAAAGWLVMHVGVLPVVLKARVLGGSISSPQANFIIYAAGTVYMVLVLGGFLRREFDTLCENFSACLREILKCYGIMLAVNLVINLATTIAAGQINSNTSAVVDMAGENMGKTAAMSIIMAPLIEELIFRAGIFGTIRKKSRTWAYIIGIAAFSAYHVWSYAIHNPLYWIFMLQYVPASWLLCRCYERCGTIWGSIIMHMVINGVSVLLISAIMPYLA